MSQETSYLWYYMFPRSGVAYGPARFRTPVTEAQARKEIRSVWGLTRLPRGTQVWSTTQVELEATIENNRPVNEGMPLP